MWESRRLWIDGFVCLEVQDSERDQSWKKRLIDNKIPLVTELDTRNIVLRLRRELTGELLCKLRQNKRRAQKQKR